MNLLREEARGVVVFFVSSLADLAIDSNLDNDLVTVCTVTSDKVP